MLYWHIYQDSGKSKSEALNELWNIAEGRINAIDAWKEHTLDDLNKLKTENRLVFLEESHIRATHSEQKLLKTQSLL